MKAEFLEKYDRLLDMTTGSIAVSHDRERIFVCAQGTPVEKDREGKRYPIKVIIDLNNLHEQYLGDSFTSIRIKKLEQGDKFLITV